MKGGTYIPIENNLYFKSKYLSIAQDNLWEESDKTKTFEPVSKQKTKITSAAFEQTTNFLTKNIYISTATLHIYAAHSTFKKIYFGSDELIFWPIFSAKQPTVHVIHSARQTSHLYKVRGVRWFTSTSNLALIMHEIEFPNKQRRRSQTM